MDDSDLFIVSLCLRPPRFSQALKMSAAHMASALAKEFNGGRPAVITEQLLALAELHGLQQLLEEQERLRREVVTRGRAYGERMQVA